MSRPIASKRRERRESRWGTNRIRWDTPLPGVVNGRTPAAAPPVDVGVVEVPELPGTPMVPAERLRLSIPDSPKLALTVAFCDADAWSPMAAVRRLWLATTEVGDRGCTGGGGDSSRGGSALIWDWELLRGLPRRKDPKIVVRKGGESLPT